MNIQFSEMDNLENKNNYWDVSNKPTDVKKKVKFGYDDILSSINLVVNNGVLQYMTPIDNQTNYVTSSTVSNPYRNTPTANANTNANTSNPPVKKVSIDPQVKNSAIYNKYFKNYKDPNEPEVKPRTFKTREELIRFLLEERQKKIQAQKRIAEIKSKKLLFGVTPAPIYTSQPNLNHLFKFKG
jgi:hypothetical protein